MFVIANTQWPEAILSKDEKRKGQITSEDLTGEPISVEVLTTMTYYEPLPPPPQIQETENTEDL